jgi:O-methyltransferase involved in polyketide biosynthesis
VLSQLAHRFEGSLIVFDIAGVVTVRNQHRNGSMHAVAARMQWVCDDPRQLERWGPELLDTRTFATPQPDIATTWPAGFPLSSTATNSICLGSLRSPDARIPKGNTSGADLVWLMF